MPTPNKLSPYLSAKVLGNGRQDPLNFDVDDDMRSAHSSIHQDEHQPSHQQQQQQQGVLYGASGKRSDTELVSSKAEAVTGAAGAQALQVEGKVSQAATSPSSTAAAAAPAATSPMSASRALPSHELGGYSVLSGERLAKVDEQEQPLEQHHPAGPAAAAAAAHVTVPAMSADTTTQAASAKSPPAPFEQ